MSQDVFTALGYENRATLLCEFKSDEYGEIDDFVSYEQDIVKVIVQDAYGSTDVANK